MTETILELAALVVALSCIASCAWQRRLAAPAGKPGLREALQSRQTAYLFSCVMLAASCVVSMAGRLAARLALGSPIQDPRLRQRRAAGDAAARPRALCLARPGGRRRP